MTPRSVQIATAVLLLAFTAWYGFVCVKHGYWDYTKASKPPTPGIKEEKQGTDFTAFYSAGELARQNKNIYDWRSSSTPRRPFIYPPMFALLPMLPLSLLSHNGAAAIFYAMNALALAAGLWLLSKMLWSEKPRGNSFWSWPGFGAIAAVALCWRFIHSNTIVGNANLIIFFLIVLGLYLDWRSRNRPATGVGSGLSIALASAYKLTPGIFGIFFLWSRRPWAMGGGALGLVLFLVLLPAMWFGWEMNTKYLRAFAKNAAGKAMSAPEQASGADEIVIGWGTKPGEPKKIDPDDDDDNSAEKYPAGQGVSFRGPLANLLTPANALKDRGDNAKRTINILSLEPEQARMAATVFSLLLLGLTVWLTYSARLKDDPRNLALSWSLVAVTMVLISPMTRIAHLVVLLLPVATLIALLQQRALNAAARKLAWTALILLNAGTALVSGLAKYSKVVEAIQTGGFTTVALVVMYAAVAVALRNVARRSAP